MSVDSSIPSVERPAFFPGQRLTAADLATTQDAHRHLRWLHNSTMHPWGIARGLQVIGERGDRDVRVCPGYAVDCHGRELLVPDAQTLPIPAAAGEPADDEEPATFYLTAAYPDVAIVSQTRTGVCQPNGTVRVNEQAVLRWKPSEDSSAAVDTWRGTNIILATIHVRDCKLAEPVSPTDRREIRPVSEPYMFAGATNSGATSWRWWPDNASASGAYGVATTVDTSVAGYLRIPRYFAQVAGDRKVGSHWMDGLARLDKPTASQFDLVVALPRDVPVFDNLKLNPAAAFTTTTLGSLGKAWHVVWMGVELWP
jgi:hypothetical protein